MNIAGAYTLQIGLRYTLKFSMNKEARQLVGGFYLALRHIDNLFSRISH